MLDDAVAQGVTVDHFYTPLLRQVYEALLPIAAAGEIPDELAVWEHVRKSDPEVTLADINDLSREYSTGIQSPRYIAGILRCHELRQLHNLGLRVIDQTQKQVEPAEIIAQMEKAALELGASEGAEGFHPAVDSAVKLIKKRNDTGYGLIGLPTGIGLLDSITTGLRPGSLNILGGRPGGGKTTLGLQIALNIARSGKSVRFWSLEMTKEQVAEKLLANVSGVHVHKAADGMLTEPDMYELAKAGEEIQSLTLAVEDRAMVNPSIVRSTLRRDLRKSPAPALVVVDYLQLVRPSDRFLPREQQVASMTRELKLLALDTGVPILCLSQLNRAGETEGGREPRVSDLRESGAIEQDADAVLLLWPDEDPSKVNLKVAKNRHGPCGRLSLDFARGLHRLTA
ncbi:replicative DNA helicase [Limnobacter sp.]|uniref:replicative DNA helicase n=1 Tax=Limnobacter sp. TaxID=2003368 RepID=UPI0025BB7B31|nr:replicative DNA helicase [Limnobacter sp.]